MAWKQWKQKGTRAWAVARHQGLSALLRRASAWVRHRLPGRDNAAAASYFDERRAQDAAFDAETGLDTGGIIDLGDLTITGPNAALGNAYMATTPDEFAAGLAALDLPVEGMSFVDLGSGKGRTLFLAARHPFARIIGVEFARELHEAALANLARLPADRRIELVHGDAATYSLPEGPLLLFIYNAFDRPLMARIAARTLDAWRAAPRPLRVLLINPVLAEVWLAAGWREIAHDPSFSLLAPD
ncbi:MAG: class I SAM-dependent methyltransferase [Sphingomonas sp.]|nr:class I SAM-dependent methyltransferase [Sphingomonas sp.]